MNVPDAPSPPRVPTSPRANLDADLDADLDSDVADLLARIDTYLDNSHVHESFSRSIGEDRRWEDDSDLDLGDLGDLGEEDEDPADPSHTTPAIRDSPVAPYLADVAFLQRGHAGDLYLTPTEWALEFMWPALLGIAPDRLKWLIRHGTFASRLLVLKRAIPQLEALLDAGFCFFGDNCSCGGRKFGSPSSLVSHFFTFGFMRFSAVFFMQPRKLQFYSMYNFFVRQPNEVWHSWLDFYRNAMLPYMYGPESNFVFLRESAAEYLTELTGVFHQDSAGAFNEWSAPEMAGYAYLAPGDHPGLPISV